MKLPDIETVSAQVHATWMDSKRAQGVTTRQAEDGEELMVPYDQLTEKAKELDRGTVKAVYAAIEAAREREAAQWVNDTMRRNADKPMDWDKWEAAHGH